MSIEVGERILLWRKAKGLTRDELAKAAGVSVAAVYQWEGTGGSKTVPQLVHLERVVRALGVSMERFYGRVPKKRAS